MGLTKLAKQLTIQEMIVDFACHPVFFHAFLLNLQRNPKFYGYEEDNTFNGAFTDGLWIYPSPSDYRRCC